VDASGVRIPEFAVPDLSMDVLVPGSGVTRGTGVARPFGPLVAWGEPGGGPGGAAYSALTVDEPPRLLTLPPLEYPPLLRTAGLDGLVVIEVVIDSTGRPEPATLRVVEASHRGFVPEAMRVVTGARFRPGRVRGQAVRVLIRQPIAFRLAR
jgi:TonB family protein